MVRYCNSKGDINGTNYVGGLLGRNYETVTNSYFSGYVNGSEYIGGLIGSNVYGPISNSSTSGVDRGVGYVGGLIGSDFGVLTNCSSSSSIIDFIRDNREICESVIEVPTPNSILLCHTRNRTLILNSS